MNHYANSHSLSTKRVTANDPEALFRLQTLLYSAETDIIIDKLEAVKKLTLAADVVHAGILKKRKRCELLPEDLSLLQRFEQTINTTASELSYDVIESTTLCKLLQNSSAPILSGYGLTQPQTNAFFRFIPTNLDAMPLSLPPPHQTTTAQNPAGPSVQAPFSAASLLREVLPATSKLPPAKPKTNPISTLSRVRQHKVANYNYGKSATNTDDDDYVEQPINEFKTARTQYEEECLKRGVVPSYPTSAPATKGWQPSSVVSNTNHLKKRKRTFDSPLQDDDDESTRGYVTPPKLPKLSNNAPPPPNPSSKAEANGLEERDEFKGIDPELIERIESEILDHSLNVRFSDIAGLENVKRALNEMVVLPAKNPQLFTGLRAPPKGLLLFGPPGNGKTLIAKAVAAEANMTFFSISASVLCSKWIGEGEKTVRALFAVARARQPAFIFIDEIDSILSARSQEEHESTRRLKNEFLIQFEGATTNGNERILVMGATNRPQDIDDAAKRRLSKRIYVPLPDHAARRQLLDIMLKNERHVLSNEDLNTVSQWLEGYSGSDIKLVCHEAAMLPVRELDISADLTTASVRPIALADFQNAIAAIKPSVDPEQCKIYEAWQRQFGTA